MPLIKYICFTLLLFCSCSQRTVDEQEYVETYLLRGPSALAFAHWMKEQPTLDGKVIRFHFLDSPELMQAALIKGEADIAVLPMISAANLYNKGIHYRLAGCPIWGTLYLAGKKKPAAADGTPPVLHLFGAGTTPDILTRYYLEQRQLTFQLNYTFATPRELLQAYRAGKVEQAVWAEPFLSMQLQQDSTLQIWADLNRPNATAMGFPQTAILYAEALQERQAALDSLLASSCRFANEQPEAAIHLVEQQQLFPVGLLTPAGVNRCQIIYRPAADVVAEIARFLQIIKQYEPKALGGRLPDASFYNTPSVR